MPAPVSSQRSTLEKAMYSSTAASKLMYCTRTDCFRTRASLPCPPLRLDCSTTFDCPNFGLLSSSCDHIHRISLSEPYQSRHRLPEATTQPNPAQLPRTNVCHQEKEDLNMSHVVERLDHPSSYKDNHARVSTVSLIHCFSTDIASINRKAEKSVKQDSQTRRHSTSVT